MRLTFTKFFPLLLLLCLSIGLKAQKPKPIVNARQNPGSFMIAKSDFDHLFTMKTKDVVIAKNNKYLDKASVMMNTLNGDTKFMKIKLSYFQNAYLMIQVNGEYSTQIFILSDDKSVFYKGHLEKGSVTMTKCNEDDIVSE